MAYLLDTNILSELRKGNQANAAVRSWYAIAQSSKPFFSVVAMGELRHGIELLRRRDLTTARYLARWLGELTRDFNGQILPVTLEIADLWGRLCPTQRLLTADGLMAATALVHDLTLVTRNVRDFERSGVRLVNPFVSS